MNEQLLHKFLNNEITAAEMETLQTTDTYRDYLKIASTTSSMHPPTFNQERVWQKLSEKTKKQAKVISLSFFRPLIKYAAIFALLLAGYLYVTNLDVSVTSHLAEKKNITLPDNSEVVLNADSKVIYNKNSWNKKRSLSLNGEAFFKVAKGKKFDVVTPQGVVSVMGTQFNVQSRKNHFHISCFEGLVRVNFNNQEIQLPAGNSVLIENGILIAQQNISTTQPGWMFNESTFENTPLIAVIGELQRQYNIEVVFKISDKNILYTGTFTHTNLDAALKTICEPLKLKYSIDDKRGVIIYED
ncbi:MAG: histidine kinase [Bacteroidetes bacterium HGW-Bacteroidetes-2]|jgi:ferric-dicitrate binding protein FerR (iron transport regulator)|nr:MAG: histidine kinase [Bacteroidetes bacterium HGW-Bacteroidetes-2]